MVRWFLAHYERAEDSTPVDGGEYVFIWGAPEEPIDVIGAEFSCKLSEADIERAVELLEACDALWVPVGEIDWNDPTIDLEFGICDAEGIGDNYYDDFGVN